MNKIERKYWNEKVGRRDLKNEEKRLECMKREKRLK